MGRVSVSPSTGQVGDFLTCSASATDADGGTPSISYAWQDGSTRSTYTISTTDDPGDTLTCTATADDGDGGTDSDFATATVINTPPTDPGRITISPSSPSSSVDLVCNIGTTSTDADVDRISYDIVWTVGGSTYTGTTSTTSYAGDTVPSSATVSGDSWQCFVTASDGTDTSAQVPSTTVTITSLTVTYNITSSMLSGLGSDCSSTGTAPYNTCSGNWGFNWTSTTSSTPSSMTITIRTGIQCASATTRTVSLNSTSIGTYPHTGNCNCNPTGSTQTLTSTSLSSYISGSSNSILVSGATSCEGPEADGTLGTGIYATVDVTY
jgi:hypothetical protein